MLRGLMGRLILVVREILAAFGDAARYYWQQRAALFDYVAHRLGLLSSERRAREIRYPLKEHHAFVEFDGNFWEVTLPRRCVVCGGNEDLQPCEQPHHLPQIAWLFWCPLVLCGAGGAAAFALSVWVFPLFAMAGFWLGYRGAPQQVLVQLRMMRCPSHVSDQEGPLVRALGKQLVVLPASKLTTPGRLPRPVAGKAPEERAEVEGATPRAHHQAARTPEHAAMPPDAPVARVCPECGQKLLPRETSCPHCLSRRAAVASGRVKVEEPESDAPGIPFPFDIATPLGCFALHGDPPSGAVFSPVDPCVASCDEKGEVYVWDLESQEIRCRFRETRGGIRRMVYSADGRTLLGSVCQELLGGIGRPTNYLVLRDAATGEELSAHKHRGARDFSIGLSSSGDVLYSYDERGVLRARDAATGKVLRKRRIHRVSATAHVAFSPVGDRAIVAYLNGSLSLWQLDPFVRLGWLPSKPHWYSRSRAHPSSINDLEFSADGQTALSASGEQYAAGNELSEGSAFWGLGMICALLGAGAGWAVGSWVSTPDSTWVGGGAAIGLFLGLGLGSQLASSGREHQRVGSARICLWDLSTEREIRRLENPGAIHEDGVANVGLCPQRNLAMSSGFGRITSPDKEMSWWKRYSTACVWDLSSGQPVAQFQGPDWRFSPDGRYALALSSLGVHIMKLHAGEDEAELAQGL